MANPVPIKEGIVYTMCKPCRLPLCRHAEQGRAWLECHGCGGRRAI